MRGERERRVKAGKLDTERREVIDTGEGKEGKETSRGKERVQGKRDTTGKREGKDGVEE